jgi:DNA end-binding protein Ku
MEESQKVAIARVVIRQKEQLVAIRPSEGVLAMSTMNFADEVVSPDRFDDAPGDDVETTSREVDMARQLIDSLSSEWTPDKYRDTYRERVLELIEQKAEGKEIAIQPVEEPQQVPDLMAALEASVKAAQQNRDDEDEAPKKRKAAAKSSNGAGAKKGTRAKEKAKK